MKAQLFTLLAAAAVGTGTVQARGEYAEIARLRGMNETVRGIRSMADGEHYTTLEGSNIVRYGYATAGQGEQMLPKPTANLVDHGLLLLARRAADTDRFGVEADLPPLLHDQLFPGSGNSLMPVLREAEAPRDASFSPDGKLIAYSDRNDLYVYDTAGKRRAASLTTVRGIRSSTARRTGSTRRSSASPEPMPSRPTAAASPTCASTNLRCP